MKRFKKLFFAITLLLAISFIIPTNIVLAYNVKTPTIVNIEHNLTQDTFFLTGITDINTEVMVYVDGVFAGEAKITNFSKEINNFSFILPTNIESGQHKVKVLAKEKTSLLLSVFSNELDYYIKPLPAPTMIEPNENTVTGNVKPYIKGLIPSGTFARIYIDGVYNGKTEILEHESGTANFAYKPFLNLNAGNHTAWAITETVNGKKSIVSNILHFKIEQPFPSPTLLAPVINQKTTSAQPFIVGLAKNDSLIKVFIDQKLYGEFLVKNHDSGTANFAYMVPTNLSPGGHIVYTTSADSKGKESVWSNIAKFNVIETKTPKISDHAASDEIAQSLILNALDDKNTNNSLPTANNKDNEITEENNIAVGEGEKDNINDLLENNTNEDNQIKTEEKNTETGLIDENNEQQGKVRLNLIIFIIFLISVIAWIFWVNRELIKEKKEQEKNNDKMDSGKPQMMNEKTEPDKGETNFKTKN